jgi:hypothetical protein
MRQMLSGPPRTRHAITDLYDEEQRAFLVHYPVLLIVGLGLAGVAAFALAGFLGYSLSGQPHSYAGADRAFAQPWELFLWFSALEITLLASILRDQSLRRRLIATVIVALLAVLVVGIIYFSSSLPQFIQQILNQHLLLRKIVGSPVTYTIVNFGLLAIFWADTVRRWLRRARGLPPNPRVNIGVESGADDKDMPSLQELISGDLIAGALLALLLSIVFKTNVIASVIHTQPPVDTCRVTWPIGSCPIGGGGGIGDPPTLTFMDLIQTLVYLPLGLIVLALTATVSGLSAVGGVNERGAGQEAPVAATAGRSSTVPIAEDVATTVLTTLKSALDRRLRLLASNLALSLRMIGWPSLIVFGTWGLAELSTYIQSYLHSPKTLANALANGLPAAGWGLAAALTTVFAAALMLFRWRVAANTLRFLGLVGFIVLLTFWIFSLALWGFNQLLLQTGASARHPFDPPSWTTAISFAALVLFGLFLGLRGVRKPATQSETAASAPALVGATRPTSDPGATTAPSPPPGQPQG